MALIKRYHKPACIGGDCDCTWRLDYRPQGLTGPRKRIEFPTKKAAEKYLATTAVKVARGEYVDPARIPTFAKVGEEWMREKSNRHPATLGGWRVHLRHLAKLDNFRLDRIDVALIENVRDELCTKLGAKTVSTVLTTCAAVFKLAIRRGYTATNPAAIAERPRREVAEVTTDADRPESGQGLRAVRPDEVLTAQEIRRLLEHAEPGLHRTLFATVAATGLRPEEAYALKWTDIQLDDGRLFVRRSLSWARKSGEEGRVRPKFYEPKTRSGYRTMPLPAGLVAALKVWKLQSPRSEHDLVFCRLDLASGFVSSAAARRAQGRQHQDVAPLVRERADSVWGADHRGAASPWPLEPGGHAEGLFALVQGCRYGRGRPLRARVPPEPRRKWAKSGH